jgi:hypothetical protein
VRRRFRGRVQNVTDMPFDDNFLDGDGWEAE